jgi:protease-4
MENDLEKNVMQNVLMAAIKEQRSSRRWKIFFRFVWIIIIGTLLYIFTSEKDEFHSNKPIVGVVNLNGVINKDNETYETVDEGLRYALEDKNTVAVIIKANSPGGSPVYSDMLYNEILRLRKIYPKKPINVVVEEVCASGCYYIASAADKIYSSPASIVGSIGVIYTGFGLTGLMQKIGVDSRLLISGKNKAMGYPFVEEDKNQVAMQQEMLNEVHQQFINAVKVGRGSKLNLSNPDIFSGRYWVGEQAIKLGLIDGYSTVDKLSRDIYKTDNIVDFTPEQEPFYKIAKKFGVGLADSAKQTISDGDFGSFK